VVGDFQLLLLGLHVTISLDLNVLTGTNPLAYFPGAGVMNKKSIKTLTPGVNVIKLFSFVTDNEA